MAQMGWQRKWLLVWRGVKVCKTGELMKWGNVLKDFDSLARDWVILLVVQMRKYLSFKKEPHKKPCNAEKVHINPPLHWFNLT